MFSTLAFAQDAPAPQGPTLLDQLPFILGMILIFYFLMIRPQQKRAKAHQDFIKNLKRGDQVLTSGGIFGTIEGLTDDFVTLEIADDVKIRILKAQITSSIQNSEEKRK